MLLLLLEAEHDSLCFRRASIIVLALHFAGFLAAGGRCLEQDISRSRRRCLAARNDRSEGAGFHKIEIAESAV